MDTERKYGLCLLIIGILSAFGMVITSGWLCYILYSISLPSILYGVGSFLIPKTRRKYPGNLPFRGI
ncbi:hypothetical protein J422_00576 [Methanocaldococcus villosus KIN24-T80]|uniref:Uncharacterized protein n=1 Tax=Methanocaldococcus villosus KIN24-T80 TaxID=1069083 RepID=N6VU93_9EURY|nr:hypothetical protein [Methanocaldococcus villosus]ENN96766.1 hypothetical protein J422_00576 [Methanocaldococcus villosus KIN24-T80]